MKRISVSVALFAAMAIGTLPAAAQEEEPNRVLFTNVNMWDGRAEALASNMNVLVEGNMIAQVSASSISADGATVVDGRRSTGTLGSL